MIMCAGAALLEVQPDMARATAGEVAAALARGVPLRKAWIRDAKRAAAGSNRYCLRQMEPFGRKGPNWTSHQQF